MKHYWHPYYGWIPVQAWSGAYPAKDGELSGNERSRGVYGAHVARRSAPATYPSPGQQRARDELSGYSAVGYRAPRHGGYARGMSGYDIVGQAAEEAMKLASMAPMPQSYPGLPQFMPQFGQAPRETGEGRRLTMAFQNDVVINPGTLGSLIASPQEPSRFERLFLDSDNGSLAGISVRAIQVGQQSQLVANGSLPASMFAPNAVGGTLRGDTANPGITVRVDVFNNTLAARTISGGMTGEALT